MAKLRVGIIGAGGISRAQHIPAWKKISGAEVVAVADVDGKRAADTARENGIPKSFTDFRDLVKEDIDVVDICTPNRVHTPAVIAALRAGMHVICEKPLAVTTAEVRKMGELADRKKLKLMTAQHMRWTPSSTAIKKWAGTGALGDVYHARVRAFRRAFIPTAPGFIHGKLSGGGPCMDVGVHALDACLYAMGFPKPVRVTGVAKTIFAKGHTIPGMWGEWDRKLMDVEDFAAGFVHFENGATMTVEAAWLSHQEEKEDFSFRLYGTKAGVQWPAAKYFTVTNGVFVDAQLSMPKTDVWAHYEEIQAFYNCVTQNLPTPVPWTETIKVIGILEAIYRSNEKKQEVKVKL